VELFDMAQRWKELNFGVKGFTYLAQSLSLACIYLSTHTNGKWDIYFVGEEIGKFNWLC
jgi:hypothetical protein